MPNYPGVTNGVTQLVYPPTPVVLAQGSTGVAFSAETPNAPQASIQFSVSYGPSQVQTRVVSLEIIFAADPGAFEVDLQEADTDADGFYQTVSGGAIAAVAATVFTAKASCQVKCRFLRVKIVTRTNAVALTARINA